MMRINRKKSFFSRVHWIAITVIFLLITPLSVKSEDAQPPKDVSDRLVERNHKTEMQLLEISKQLKAATAELQRKKIEAEATELERKKIEAEAKKNHGKKSLNKEKLMLQKNSRKPKQKVPPKKKVNKPKKDTYQTTSLVKEPKKPESAPDQMDDTKTFKGFGFQIPTIRPGNTITITITAGTSKSTTLTVQPDGEISMQEFGKLIASGKTTTELAHVIEDILIKPEYSPVVKVEIDRLNN